MNLHDAIVASPYRTAICEMTDGRTFYVEPDEEAGLEVFDLKVADGAMPAGVIGSYNGLAALIDALANYASNPTVDADWLPVGENGEVLASN